MDLYRKSKAFSLLEVLIVVIIIGAITSIAVVKLAPFKQKAVIAIRKSTSGSINSAIHKLYMSGDRIPNAILQQTTYNGEPLNEPITILRLIQEPTSTWRKGSAPFTQQSSQEMEKIILDTTPSTGTYQVINPGTHKGLKVIYTPPQE